MASGERVAGGDRGYVDTHTHLDLTAARLKTSLAGVLEAARAGAEAAGARLEGCVHVSCSLESLAALDGLVAETGAAGLPDVRVAVGLHPHDASQWTAQAAADMEAAAGRHPGRVVAIGECGLDYHYMNSPREQQLEAFRAQVLLALRLRLPLVVHSREADEDTVALLRELLPPASPGWPVHIHCFTGSPAFAAALLPLSDRLCIGVTGAGTFASAHGLHEAIRQIPLERFLLETDAPYMAPVPHRGKVCHSGMIPHVAQRIATLKQQDLDTVYQQIRINTSRVYPFETPK